MTFRSGPKLPMGSERGRMRAALDAWAHAERLNAQRKARTEPEDADWHCGYARAMEDVGRKLRDVCDPEELPESDVIPLPDGWTTREPRQFPEALVEATNGRSVLMFIPREGWSANTPAGMVWNVFDDYRQYAVCAIAEAARQAEQTEATGRPPFGGWS